MAAQDREIRGGPRAPLPRAHAARRLLAWLYTGPLGHLWSTAADVVSLWLRWAVAGARRRLRERYSNR
ncbi:MAG: hypothetical protein JOZ25_07285 [Actinobacteria bacterium]|nr:hypothetical protein [Actinomycetota bacterium]